jgi:hypothetical protein
MPYEKKVWCPHPSHSVLTQSGRTPSHPEGRRIINAIQADFLNNQIISTAEGASKILAAGDKVCQRCYNFLPTVSDESFDSQEVDVDNEDQVITDHSSDDSNESFGPSPSEARLYNRQEAKEELNAVFQLLKMEKIRDE